MNGEQRYLITTNFQLEAVACVAEIRYLLNLGAYVISNEGEKSVSLYLEISRYTRNDRDFKATNVILAKLWW